MSSRSGQRTQSEWELPAAPQYRVTRSTSSLMHRSTQVTYIITSREARYKIVHYVTTLQAELALVSDDPLLLHQRHGLLERLHRCGDVVLSVGDRRDAAAVEERNTLQQHANV